MIESEQLYFRISSSLKDIIGKDLITDDYIAVFELVKNSFDAYSKNVHIHFLDIYSENSKILIVDDGKGMDINDIKDRWLFVAYSAKKDGTEDLNYDYRNRISINRIFAGAKGIGRFSCDRLGRILILETKKDSINSRLETIVTDWGKFEIDSKDEFVDISVLHESVESERSNGTKLEITELRSGWDRKKILKLKDSLAKLITPFNSIDENDFKIFLHVPDELENDLACENDYEKVNGEIYNFIFDTLDLKTTKIISQISPDGHFCTTELIDGGTVIYKITENNKFELLKGVEISVYFLNHSAKVTFVKKMGVNSVNYGHVFVYKNGFRVYPYGEPGEDTLGVDLRKGQGYNRYLGTREIMGQIQINSKAIDLKETSSRGDGFIKNTTYEYLIEFFWESLRRLERYVVEVQQWGLSIEDLENTYGLKERIVDLLAKVSGESSIIKVEMPDNIIEILNASQGNSAYVLSNNLSRIAFERGDEKLISESKKIADKIIELQHARLTAEKQLDVETQKAIDATRELREQISENLFLKSINTEDFQEVISLLHHIGIYAGTIDNNLKGISLRIQNNIQLSNEELYDIIRKISFETKKILNISSFATKANFKLYAEQISIDLISYMREYIQNIIPTTTDRNIKVEFNNYSDISFIKEIKPIELNIVIDNLINNAKKANSKTISFNTNVINEELVVDVIDDGSGIPEDNLKRIFDFGFTTTDGSGLGLFHVKKIINSIGGKISIKNNLDKGVTFKLTINKNETI